VSAKPVLSALIPVYNDMSRAYEDLTAELLEVLPEINPAYMEMAREWHGDIPGPHFVFHEVLMPHILTLVQSGTDAAQLKRIFDFIEALANHPDSRIQSIVGVTVCEYIACDEVLLERTKRYLGAKTKKLLDQTL